MDENLSPRITTLAEWHWFDIDCARLDGMVDLYGDIDAALGQSDKVLRRKLDVDDAVVLRPSGPTVGIGTQRDTSSSDGRSVVSDSDVPWFVLHGLNTRQGDSNLTEQFAR